MLTNKKFIAIIPARGGSKRLPDKNIRLLNGLPLIAHSINAAKKCNLIDEIMVTTDSEKIQRIALKYGANSPFLRPQDLATDTATSFDAVKHTIEFYEKKLGKTYDYLVLLQPTSPLRTSINIEQALHLLIEKQADAIISVSLMEHNPLKSNLLPENLSLEKFQPEHVKNKRMQDLPKYYRENGAIYILNIERFLEEKTFFIKNNIFAYIMKPEESVDVDTKLDFIIAEALIKPSNL